MRDGDYDYDEAVDALTRVFGIVGICPVSQSWRINGFDKLAKDVLEYMDNVYPDKNITFKVDARRARKNYPMHSMEINADLGETILDAYPGDESRCTSSRMIMLNVEIRARN